MATIDFILKNTDIPVPRIWTLDDASLESKPAPEPASGERCSTQQNSIWQRLLRLLQMMQRKIVQFGHDAYQFLRTIKLATINLFYKKSGSAKSHSLAPEAVSENELGFEWILEEMLPGTQLKMAWRKLSMSVLYTSRSLFFLLAPSCD